VRFVPTLDAVPPEWRSRVGFVELSTPPTLTPGDAQRIRNAKAKRASAPIEDDPAAADERSSASAEIILYSADWCGACRAAKSYMDQKGIEYDERNVDEVRWRDEMQAKAGPGGIPVFDIGGQILRGFSPQLLDQAIQSAS
jgi:glutaredoxin